MVIAAATAVVGRQYYGTLAASTRSVNRHAYIPQSGLRTEATLCRKRLRSSRAPAGAASACPTHGHSISWSTTRGLWRGPLSFLTSLRAACVLVAFCESARHHRSGMGSSLIPSSIAFVMFYICFDQMQNNLISQAAQMEASGTPNDLLPAMNQVGCIVLGPSSALVPPDRGFLATRPVGPTPWPPLAVVHWCQRPSPCHGRSLCYVSHASHQSSAARDLRLACAAASWVPFI
jgi:hypothetical protein